MSSANARYPRSMTGRRARISAIIATTDVTSQEELGHLLAEEGIHVTQATLSRDLDAIGAVKAVGGSGALHYEVDGLSAADTSIPHMGSEGTLSRLATDLLVRAEAAGNIAVIHTPPGAAQFFAGHLDRSTVFDTVGTVAGDDTIIIVLRTPAAAVELCTSLLKMAEQRRTS